MRDMIDPLTVVRELRCTIADGPLEVVMAECVPNMAAQYPWLEVFHLRLEGQNARRTVVSSCYYDVIVV